MSNRIVVDYYGEKKLVLLAKIQTSTGIEVSYEELQKYSKYGFEIARRFTNFKDFKSLAALNTPNAEGFVIRFTNTNERIKVKFSDYKRLHRIVTGVSSTSIWDSLSKGESLNEMLEMVPDEFNNWAKSVIEKLQNNYTILEQEGLALYDAVKALPTRKDQAMYITASKSPVGFIAYKKLDGKSYADGIWKLIKPIYQQPFSSRENV
jgi:RNA ligase